MSYFLVERQDMNQRNSKGDEITYSDLLAAGNGMYGGMGSGQFFSVSLVKSGDSCVRNGLMG